MSETESMSSPGADWRVEELCRLFERALEADPTPPRPEDYVQVAKGVGRGLLLERLLLLEVCWRRERGDNPDPADYLARFPRDLETVVRVFRAAPAVRPPNEEKTIHGPPPFPDSSADDSAEERFSEAATGFAPDGEEGEKPVWWPTLPDYEILDEIGQGGMGVVYRARHRGLRRLVALKMVAGVSHTATQLRRFKAEAEAIARVQHPNIVQIFEVGEHKGQPFFALELVEGGTLRTRIAQHPLAVSEGTRIIEAVARAIHQAHTQGIIHRDLKPGNILMTPEGEPKVTDFGVAKLLDNDRERTRTGAVLGTPEYMSPEQARGQSRKIGPATDVYALGVILFEILTGGRPIEGETEMQTVERLLFAEPASLRSRLPDSTSSAAVGDLEAIYQKCLEKDLHRRYATALELAEDLARWRAGEPVRARPVGKIGRLWRWARRKPVSAALAVISALLVLTFVIATPALWILYRETESLRLRAVDAEHEALKLQHEALEQAREARNQHREAGRRAARLSAAAGARLIDEGDHFRALVWTADALRREQALTSGAENAAAREDLLRVRFEALLDDSPRLAHTLQTQPWVERLVPDAGCNYLYGLDRQGTRVNRRRIADGAEEALEFRPDPPARELLFGADARVALARHEDGSLRFWAISDGRQLCALAEAPDRDQRGPLLYWVADRNRRRLFAVLRGEKGDAGWLWSLEDGRRLHREPETIHSWDDRCEAMFDDAGMRLLVSAPGGTVVLDADSGRRLTQSPLPIAGGTLSPTGNLVGGVEDSGKPVLWDVINDRVARLPAVASSPVRQVYFNPAGTALLLIGEDARVRLVSATSGEPLLDPLVHDGVVREVRVSPDERLLLTVTESGTCRVWNLFSGRPATPPLRDGEAVITAAWSADGRRVLTGARGGSVRVWDLARLARPSREFPHEGEVLCVAFDGTGERLLAGDADGAARVRDVTTGKALGPILRHAGPVRALAWGREGRVLTLSEGLARVWEWESAKPLTRPLPARLARINPAGDRLLLVGERRAVVHDISRDVPLCALAGGDAAPVVDAVFSPDGGRIATAELTGTVRLWDAAKGQSLAELSAPGRVNSVRYLDANYLAATGTFGLCVWDVADGRETLRLPGAGHPAVRSAELSRDGRWLLTMNTENTCRVWEVANGQPIGTPFRPGAPLLLASVLAGGRQAVTALREGTLRVWDTATGEPLTPAIRSDSFLHDATTSPDGRSVALAGKSRKLLLHRLPGPVPRPAESPYRLATLLAACEIDPNTGTLIERPTAGLRAGHAVLAGEMPGEFTTPAAEILQWHADLASECEVRRRWPAALFHLRFLLDAAPDDLGLIARRADAARALGRTEDALSDLDTLVSRQPKDTGYRTLRSRRLLAAGEFAKARADVEEALKSEPSDGSLHLRHSFLLARLERPQEAARAYRAALERGIDLTYRSYFDPAYREDPRRVYDRKKQWRAMRSDVQLLLDGFDETRDDLRWLPLLYTHLALSCAAAEDWQGVKDAVRQALRFGKFTAEIARLRILAAVAHGETDAATDLASTALEEETGDATLWSLRGHLLARAERRAEARDDFRKACELAPTRPDLVLPSILLTLRTVPPGVTREKDLRTLVGGLLPSPPRLPADPEEIAALLWPALFIPGRDTGLSEWLPLLDRVPRDSLPAGEHDLLRGALALRSGDVPQALTALLRAAEADSDGGSARAWYFLALAHQTQGDPAAADRARERAQKWLARQRAGKLTDDRDRRALTWQELSELKVLEAEVSSPGAN